MVTSKKQSETWNKFLRRCIEEYPDIQWGIGQPDQEIIDNYGEGLILAGRKGIFEESFFILSTDKRRDHWAALIVHKLRKQVDDANK